MTKTNPDQNIFIKSVNWVGDVIMSTPAIRALRREYPQARIVVAARPSVSPLLEDNPDVDEVWQENGRSELVARLKPEAFDLGFAFPNSFGSAWLLWAGGIRERIGYGRDARSLILTRAVPCTRDILACHQVEYYLNLLRTVMEVQDGERELVLEVNPQAAAEVETILAGEGIKSGQRLIGINPGAFYGSAKRWLPERFAEAADRLTDMTDWHVISLGTEKERPVGEEIAALCTRPVINLAGRLNLKQAVAMMDRLSFLVTNDSGGMHLAAARGVPMVAVFGSTDWRTTYPYHPDARLVRHDTPCAPCLLRECPIDHRCMTVVTVDEVIATAEELLSAALA